MLVAQAAVASPVRADHCQTTGGEGGGVSEAGAVEAWLSETSHCANDSAPGAGGTRKYPFYFWETWDIFFGTAGCPAGEVQGIRRYFVISAPGAEPVWAYDTDGCVPLPTSPDEVQLDATDIEAILRGQLPTPSVARDPYVDGLVNLETYFWYDGGTLQNVDHDGDPATAPVPGWTGTVTQDGVTVSATLYVTRFSWQVEPGTTIGAPRPGSPDDPAASHVYTTTGTYDLVASTTWAGSYSWSVAGAPGGSGTLNGVTLDSPPEPFRVREVRAVPADPEV